MSKLDNRFEMRLSAWEKTVADFLAERLDYTVSAVLRELLPESVEIAQAISESGLTLRAFTAAATAELLRDFMANDPERPLCSEQLQRAAGNLHKLAKFYVIYCRACRGESGYKLIRCDTESKKFFAIGPGEK